MAISSLWSISRRPIVRQKSFAAFQVTHGEDGVTDPDPVDVPPWTKNFSRRIVHTTRPFGPRGVTFTATGGATAAATRLAGRDRRPCIMEETAEDILARLQRYADSVDAAAGVRRGRATRDAGLNGAPTPGRTATAVLTSERIYPEIVVEHDGDDITIEVLPDHSFGAIGHAVAGQGIRGGGVHPDARSRG